MSFQLPRTGDISLPEVPVGDLVTDPVELRRYLIRTKRQIEELSRGMFANDSMSIEAINTARGLATVADPDGSLADVTAKVKDLIDRLQSAGIIL